MQAIYPMTSGKMRIGSRQPSRTLGIAVRSARFLSRGIREAMRSDGAVDFGDNNREDNAPDATARVAIAPPGVAGRRLLYRDSFVG
ncbi:MAG: hypothetical protein OXI64_03930 [Defluviicoccus sp.]|nr:hypothetical protein [Defluviicoccus sp.]